MTHLQRLAHRLGLAATDDATARRAIFDRWRELKLERLRLQDPLSIGALWGDSIIALSTQPERTTTMANALVDDANRRRAEHDQQTQAGQLDEITAAWPTLPPAIQEQILQLVRANAPAAPIAASYGTRRGKVNPLLADAERRAQAGLAAGLSVGG